MVGGAGNDTYFVDNVGDVVNETVGGGTADTVFTSVNYALAAGQEIESIAVATTTGLTVSGNELSHRLIGNAGNDTLIGGAGNDALDGKAGADSMVGGAGNDTYSVDNIGDIVTEAAGEGTDLINTTLHTSSRLPALATSLVLAMLLPITLLVAPATILSMMVASVALTDFLAVLAMIPTSSITAET
jgi:hypothetical protein